MWSTWHDILERYRKHWEFWEQDVKTRPAMLPKVIRTAVLEQAPFAMDGELWELRCASVAVAGSDWIDVHSGMSLERWKSKFSTQPGDWEVLTRAQVIEIVGGEENIGKP